MQVEGEIPQPSVAHILHPMRHGLQVQQDVMLVKLILGHIAGSA
ncbi:hypothetical protein [Ruegeria arenilitoris]|nr:hypothetical protein [Ruegeria arenilitoris]